jgi:microcystin-dependent protein
MTNEPKQSELKAEDLELLTNEDRARLMSTEQTPVGTILSFAGVYEDSPGANWRLCAGQSVRVKDFQQLYKVIGTAWGRGDQYPNTFNLPDLRGMFLRGVARGLSTDPDRESRSGTNGGNVGDHVGSRQEYATALPLSRQFTTGNESRRHTHPASTNAITEGGPNTFDADDERGVKGSASVTVGDNIQLHTHTVDTGGDAETRPRNIYVNYIIRVK